MKERRVHVDLNQLPSRRRLAARERPRGSLGHVSEQTRANPDLSHPFTEEFGTPL